MRALQQRQMFLLCWVEILRQVNTWHGALAGEEGKEELWNFDKLTWHCRMKTETETDYIGSTSLFVILTFRPSILNAS